MPRVQCSADNVTVVSFIAGSGIHVIRIIGAALAFGKVLGLMNTWYWSKLSAVVPSAVSVTVMSQRSVTSVWTVTSALVHVGVEVVAFVIEPPPLLTVHAVRDFVVCATAQNHRKAG